MRNESDRGLDRGPVLDPVTALFEAPPAGLTGTVARALRSLHPHRYPHPHATPYRDRDSMGSLASPSDLHPDPNPDLNPNPSDPSNPNGNNNNNSHSNTVPGTLHPRPPLPLPPAQFLGWTSAGTQIWARLRMSGLEVKCVFSWDLRRILLKVRWWCDDDDDRDEGDGDCEVDTDIAMHGTISYNISFLLVSVTISFTFPLPSPTSRPGAVSAAASGGGG